MISARAAGEPATDLYGFTSGDLPEITRYLSECLMPHQLNASEPLNFQCKVKGARLRKINFITLKYNQDVELVSKQCFADCLVLVPLKGSCVVSSNISHTICDSNSLAIVANVEKLKISWKADTRLLAIKFDHSLTKSNGTNISGCQVFSKLSALNIKLHMNDPEVENFLRFADFFHKEIENKSSLEHSSLIANEIESTMLTMLLYIVEKNRGRYVKRPAIRICPPYLRRVEKYIKEHLHDNLSISDISQATNVNARTLFHSFKRYHGITPMAYIKMLRLRNVHQVLVAAEPSTTTVTEVATNWGFYHLGRFSADYKNVFKELPSETLKR